MKIPTPSNTIIAFLSTGTKPASDREKAALLDECRSTIAQLSASLKTIDREGMKQSENRGGIVIHPPSAETVQRSRNYVAQFAAWTEPKTGTDLDRLEAGSKATAAAKQKAHALLESKVAAQREKLRQHRLAASKPAAKPSSTMSRAEWSQLHHADKARFFKEGGKLI